MAATRAVALCFAASALASAALVATYLAGGNVQLEGVLLAIALGGIGIGIVIWAVRLIDAPVETEDYHDQASADEVVRDVRSGLGD